MGIGLVDDHVLRDGLRPAARPVAELTPALTWMSDADKRCTYVNTAWMVFTGRTLDHGLTGVRASRPPRYIIEIIPDLAPGSSASTPKFLHRVTAIGYGLAMRGLHRRRIQPSSAMVDAPETAAHRAGVPEPTVPAPTVRTPQSPGPG